MTNKLTRRQALTTLAAGPLGAGALQVDGAAAGAEAPAEQQPGSCVVFPQAVEGPYYFDPDLVRSDMTEGRPGAPLRLVLRIIESGPCTALAGARVDVWHADAGGVYSGYARQGDKRDVSTKGQTYMRATQISAADGGVTFRTIYPGWYPGRTPHIHVKVFLDDKTVATAQVYFPDALSARIYRERAPYSARPVADTTNATDGLFRAAGAEAGGTVLAMGEDADGTIVATLLIAVDRSGREARKAEGWGVRDLMWWRR